ncbi:MAG: adenylate/guanylate cyclase domain-containing protein [Pseudomonadota bacterium]
MNPHAYTSYRPFRWLGYGMLGTCALLLNPQAPILLVCAVVVGASIVDVLGAVLATPPELVLRRVMLAEIAVLPGALAGMGVAAPLPLAAPICVLIGGVAACGARFASSGSCAYGLGVLVAWATGIDVLGGLDLGAGLPLLLLGAFGLGVADVAQRRALELAAHRRQWQVRLRAVEPFVPAALSGRDGAAGANNARAIKGDGNDAATRAWLTIAVIDVVDFTATSERHSPETVTGVLDDLIDAAVVAADATGGVVDKFLGDGLLVIFKHADRPSAVVAALDFQRAFSARMARLGGRFESLGLRERLRWRCGIASGFCSQGPRGTGTVRAFTVIGGAVALAERLQAACAPDEVMVCQASARLLTDAQEGSDAAVSAPAIARPGESWQLTETSLTLKGFGSVRGYRATPILAKVRPA